LRVPLGNSQGRRSTPSRSRTPALPGRTCTSIFWRSPSPRRTCRRFGGLPDHRAGDRLGHAALAGHRARRTAWLIDTLGFKGRANHYAGAMWFYELSCAGNQYASAAIVFAGAPRFGDTTTVTHGRRSAPTCQPDRRYGPEHCKSLRVADHGRLVGGFGRTRRNDASRSPRARWGLAGNGLTITTDTGNTNFTAQPSPTALAGGADGVWHTDLERPLRG